MDVPGIPYLYCLRRYNSPELLSDLAENKADIRIGRPYLQKTTSGLDTLSAIFLARRSEKIPTYQGQPTKIAGRSYNPSELQLGLEQTEVRSTFLRTFVWARRLQRVRTYYSATLDQLPR